MSHKDVRTNEQDAHGILLVAIPKPEYYGKDLEEVERIENLIDQKDWDALARNYQLAWTVSLDKLW